MTAGDPRLEADGSITTRDALLARRFVTLADTLVDDYDVLDLLDQLVTSCVDLLDVTAAGLLLKDQRGSIELLASSSEATRVVELYQLEASEGPCLDAVRSGRPVVAEGLAELRSRWPSFATSAETNGFESVCACPMRLREETIGALNVFGSGESPLVADDMRIAQALADVATIGILQQRSLHRASLVAEQLQSALNSRVVIEQAKGVLAEYGKTDMDRAFQALRSFSRNRNRKLGAVADQLVRRQLDPGQVIGS
jgi:transcriptional regulator with GAF, ATPase, and Fis domain